MGTLVSDMPIQSCRTMLEVAGESSQTISISGEILPHLYVKKMFLAQVTVF